MAATEFIIERGFAQGKPTPGHQWKASFYDSATCVRASASAGTPWDAIAWAIVSWQAIQRGIANVACNANDTAEMALAKLRDIPPTRATVAANDARSRPRTEPTVSSPAISGPAFDPMTDVPPPIPSAFALTPSTPERAATRRAKTKHSAARKR